MDGLFRLSCVSCVRSSRKPCFFAPRNKLSRCRCCRRVLVSHIVVLVFQALVTSTSSERQRSLKRPGRKAKTHGDTKKGDQRGQQRIVVVVYVIYFCITIVLLFFCFCSDVMHDVNLTTMVSTWFRLMMNVSYRIWRNNCVSHEEIVWLQNLHGTASQNQGNPVFISCAWPSESIYSPSLSQPPHTKQSSRI